MLARMTSFLPRSDSRGPANVIPSSPLSVASKAILSSRRVSGTRIHLATAVRCVGGGRTVRVGVGVATLLAREGRDRSAIGQVIKIVDLGEAAVRVTHRGGRRGDFFPPLSFFDEFLFVGTAERGLSLDPSPVGLVGLRALASFLAPIAAVVPSQ